LMAEPGAHRTSWGCAVIALIEQQVEGTMDGRKPVRKISRRGKVEELVRCREHLLHYPLLDRGMAADEGGGDLVDAEAAQDIENERNLALLREARMAAREHHAQQIVLDRVRGEQFFNDRRDRPFAVEQPTEFGRKSPCCTVAPQHIERP